MTPPRHEPGRFGLAWALGISVALHLVLTLLSLWLPLRTSQAAEAPLEEDVLRFTFVEPEEEQITDGEPLGDVLLPAPESPSEPKFVPDPTPQGLPVIELPQPFEEPLPPDEAETDPTETPQPEETLDEAVEPLTGTPFPETGGLPLDQPREPGPLLDLAGSLQDFHREMSRLLAQRPRPPAGSTTPLNVFRPELSQLPTTGSQIGQLVFESTDYDWNDYARQIYWAIWRAWHNRLYLTTSDFDKWAHDGKQWMLHHRSAVRFVIEANGQVSSISVEGPSGCLPLDRSAADALAEVTLPPLPEDFPRDREVVHALFVARGEILRMRQSLQYMKQQGWF